MGEGNINPSLSAVPCPFPSFPQQQESLPDAVIPRDQSEKLSPEDDNDLTMVEAGWRVVMDHLQGGDKIQTLHSGAGTEYFLPLIPSQLPTGRLVPDDPQPQWEWLSPRIRDP